MDAETREYLTDAARTAVAGGYRTRAEIVDDLAELVDDEELDATEDEVTALVDRVWQARLAEQAGWPEVTDVDRLEAAFAALDASGVVARGDFTCCQTCGNSEIGGEVPAGASAEGYVYFHGQDTEHAAEGGALLLAYGSFAGGDEEAGAVGRRVAEELRARDLRVVWDGSVRQRIAVELDWRRRLPTG